MENRIGHAQWIGYMAEMSRAGKARSCTLQGRGVPAARVPGGMSVHALASVQKARACDLHNLHGSLTAPVPHWFRIHPW